MKTQRRVALVVALVLGGSAAVVASVAWAMSAWGIRLRIDHDVEVLMPAELPLRAAITRPLAVSIDEQLAARVSIRDLAIAIDETIEVPLRFTLDVPIDTEVAVDERIEVATTVPLDFVLTERELDLSKLEISIDSDVFVDDAVDIDTVVPIDTEVTTTLGIRVPVKMQVPIKTRIPIRQNVRVRDTLNVGVKKLRLPFKMSLPVRAVVPLKQNIRVVGAVKVPIDRVIRVPIRQVMHPDVGSPMAATVELKGELPATLSGDFEAHVSFEHAIPARLGPLHVDAADVRFERRTD